jgi:hypothetical protein
MGTSVTRGIEERLDGRLVDVDDERQGQREGADYFTDYANGNGHGHEHGEGDDGEQRTPKGTVIVGGAISESPKQT